MNKKKFLLLLLFLLFLNNLFAQNTFKKLYDFVFNNRKIIELPTGEFITGFARFSIIDYNGNINKIIWPKTPPIEAFGFVAKYKDFAHYLINGGAMDTLCANTNAGSPFLMVLDTNGVISFAKKYRIPNNCLQADADIACLNSDNSVFGAGTIVTGDFFAFCTDTALELKWAKYYSGAQYGRAGFGKETQDGGFIVGLTLRNAGASLLKLDANGNTQWCKSYIHPRGIMEDCIIEQDGSYIVAGYTDSLAVSRKLFLMKVDTAGHVLWCKGFDSVTSFQLASRLQAIKISDGNYLLYASLGVNYAKLELIKTDTNGDTLWTRTHGSANYYYEISSIIETTDKGLLMSGYSQGNYPNMATSAATFYKLDSLGHFSECNETHLPIYVYNIFPTDSDIILTSVSGGSSVSIDITDTTYAPVATYDECTINSISSVQFMNSRYRVHPNPSTGLIHIYRDDDFTNDCYYAVYNNLGKLIIQQKFINGNKDTMVDLSIYGKGIYLIHITEGIETITKKVVIE